MNHPHYGRVVVLKALEGSRTKVEFKVLQRKEGWNNAREEYEFIRAKEGSMFPRRKHHTDEYGKIDECHINELK